SGSSCAGKSLIFCGVIKLVEINFSGRVGFLPRDSSPNGLIYVDYLGIAEFGSDLLGTDHDVLPRVLSKSEGSRSTQGGQDHELAGPVGLARYPFFPFHFACARFFAHVVNSTGGFRVDGSKRNGVGDIVHIAAWAPPSGQVIAQENRASSIRDAL